MRPTDRFPIQSISKTMVATAPDHDPEPAQSPLGTERPARGRPATPGAHDGGLAHRRRCRPSARVRARQLGTLALGHSGAGPGFSTRAWTLEGKERSVVVMVNDGDGGSIADYLATSALCGRPS
jgi:hypothetical protein